ncbi:MAG: CvpA family protein [Syntrophorhabdaceae bacterium]|nr:CvpA family protein [Syntrophorhabdaceae bacterium]
MNIVDILLIVLVLFFGIFGAVRGLVRQLFAIGGLLAGHLVGIRCCSLFASVFRMHFKYAELAWYVFILLMIYIFVFILGCVVRDKVDGMKLSFMDHALGLLAGFLKGGLLVVLLVFLLVIIMPKDNKVLRESMIVPQAVAAGKLIAKGFPAHISDSFQEKVRAVEKRPPLPFFRER